MICDEYENVIQEYKVWLKLKIQRSGIARYIILGVINRDFE